MKRKVSFIVSYLLLVTMIISCQKNTKKYYYVSGELKGEIEINSEGLYDGFHKEFYKSGQIKTISRYKAGILHDTVKGYLESGELELIQFSFLGKDSAYRFYKNGDILSKGLLSDNKVSGWWDFYDKNGDKSHSIDYKIIRDTLLNNQLKVYKDQTEIIKDSSYFFNQKIPDTILVGGIYSFALEYHSNISDSSTVYFCYSKGFNEDFSNIDLVDIDTLYSGSHIIKSRIRRNDIGKSNFRGFFVEKHSEVVGVNKEDSTKVDIVTKKKRIYLDRPIYVIDSTDISVSEGLL